MNTSNLISYILLAIYNIVSQSIFSKLFFIQYLFIFFIIFVFIVIGGFISGKILSFLIKLVINLYEIDSIVETKYNNMFFGYKPSYIFSMIFKWYVYILSIIYGIQEGLYYGFNIKYNFLVYYEYSFLALISVLIFVTGVIIGGLIEYSIIKSNIKENEKELLSKLGKYLTIYVFFSFALENIGINTGILIDALDYFIIALSITIGFIFGVAIVIKYKDEIIRIIK